VPGCIECSPSALPSLSDSSLRGPLRSSRALLAQFQQRVQHLHDAYPKRA
jgi:hypothetical protein